MTLHIDYAHYDQFKKYQKDKKIFIETGTNQGNSSYTALQSGFEKVISVEIEESLYNLCLEKFKDYDNVILFHGDSKDALPKMLEMVDESAFFWIDAHYDHYDGEAHIELDIIKEHHINTHTIMVDDLPSMVDQCDALIEKIKEINQDYIIEYLDSNNNKNYKLIAYVE